MSIRLARLKGAPSLPCEFPPQIVAGPPSSLADILLSKRPSAYVGSQTEVQMSLEQKIDQDLRQAMSAKDAAKVSTLRFLKSALKYSAIEKRTQTLTDAEVQQIVQKQIKQHRESIDQFSKAGRHALAAQETKEAGILESYLPKQLSDQALEQAVIAAVKEAGAGSKKDFGKVMKLLTEKLAGQAEPKRISEALAKVLP